MMTHGDSKVDDVQQKIDSAHSNAEDGNKELAKQQMNEAQAQMEAKIGPKSSLRRRLYSSFMNVMKRMSGEY